MNDQNRIVKFTFKCVGCKKVDALTEEQLREAREMGAVMCNQCYMPMLMKKVEARHVKRKAG